MGKVKVHYCGFWPRAKRKCRVPVSAYGQLLPDESTLFIAKTSSVSAIGTFNHSHYMRYLSDLLFFYNICLSCQDETENETYISGIRCTKCPAGYFLPENPIGDRDICLLAEMRMEMVLGWGEEEGEMEVDNQFPSDCAARWICNECGMEAPKVWPHQYKKITITILIGKKQ